MTSWALCGPVKAGPGRPTRSPPPGKKYRQVPGEVKAAPRFPPALLSRGRSGESEAGDGHPGGGEDGEECPGGGERSGGWKMSSSGWAGGKFNDDRTVGKKPG